MKTPLSPNPWLVRYNSSSTAHLKLFCFPPAGAGASFYKSWSKLLPQEIALYGVQLPGRETRIQEELITDWSELIKTLVQILQPHLQQPFAFFGHSLGALLSFELAHQLQLKNSISPQYLVVSSSQPPHLSGGKTLYTKDDKVLTDSLREHGGTPEAILQDAELMAIFLKIYRADLTLNDNYIHQSKSPLNCPILALGGEEDSEVNMSELEQWEEYTSRSFRSKLIAGKHMYLMFQAEKAIEYVINNTRLNLT